MFFDLYGGDEDEDDDFGGRKREEDDDEDFERSAGLGMPKFGKKPAASDGKQAQRKPPPPSDDDDEELAPAKSSFASALGVNDDDDNAMFGSSAKAPAPRALRLQDFRSSGSRNYGSMSSGGSAAARQPPILSFSDTDLEAGSSAPLRQLNAGASSSAGGGSSSSSSSALGELDDVNAAPSFALQLGESSGFLSQV